MLLLEYALVSGIDWWDILITAPTPSVPQLSERLSETFHQHPQKIVANLYSKFLVLKNSILRWADSEIETKKVFFVVVVVGWFCYDWDLIYELDYAPKNNLTFLTVIRLSSNLHHKSIETRLQAQLSAILKLFHSLRPVTSDVVNIDKNFSTMIQSEQFNIWSSFLEIAKKYHKVISMSQSYS